MAHRKAPKTAFKPGQSGNPAGRPKGSRNKLGEDFIKALATDFEAHGVDAIKSVRAEKPDVYLKVIAQVLPRDINLNADVQHHHRVVSDSTKRVLEELAGRGEDASSPSSMPH